MPRMTAGANAAPREKREAVIDVARHHAGMIEAAATVTMLVTRLTQGKALLSTMRAEHENRGEAERLWAELCLGLHAAMREVYAHFALLRIAIGNEAALALWDAQMPSGDALADIGTADMIAYWRGRVESPEWLTYQEAQFITRSLWPPTGTDPIDRGLLDLIEPAPFD